LPKKFVLEPKLSPAKKRRDQARAGKILRTLKSYEEWVAGPETAARAAIERLCKTQPELFGRTLREYYAKFVGQLVKIQEEGNPTAYVVRELGRKGGKASAKKLTAAQRRERARRAGLAGGRGRPRAV